MKKLGLLACSAAFVSVHAQTDAHALAAKVDAHYNHLTSLSATFTETYTGMGGHRAETGTLLLRKPGRMRWSYAGGKLFLLDGKYAISYTPGDSQAQRIPAKHLDDVRSPLRFLLGHTQLDKELDHLQVTSGQAGGAVLSGTPRYQTSSGDQRLQRIAITVEPATGAITELSLQEIDGTVTNFLFTGLHENAPATDADFRFSAPPGVTITDGPPPI